MTGRLEFLSDRGVWYASAFGSDLGAFVLAWLGGGYDNYRWVMGGVAFTMPALRDWANGEIPPPDAELSQTALAVLYGLSQASVEQPTGPTVQRIASVPATDLVSLAKAFRAKHGGPVRPLITHRHVPPETVRPSGRKQTGCHART